MSVYLTSRPSKGTVPRLLLALAGCVCATAMAAGARADDEPPPEGYPPPEAPANAKVNVMSGAGSGCPSGIHTETDADGAITVNFDDYAIELGPKNGSLTKNCMVNLTIDHEQGMRYAVSQVTLRGSSELPEGTDGRVSFYYSFAGAEASSFQAVSIASLGGGAWTHTFEVPSDKLVFSECNTQRTLTLRTRIDATNSTPRQSAKVAVDALSEIKLTWQPCEG